MEPIKTALYRGYTIKIYQDENPESPASWDNFGTIYTKHNRYFAIGEDLNNAAKEERGNADRDGGVWLPIYAYVHSGVTIATTTFSCPWDSGQCGFIVASLEDIRKEFNVKRVTQKHRVKALKMLQGHVKLWDEYLTGQVYGFVIEKDGEEVDSVWGYYGKVDDLLKYACVTADAEIKRNLPLLAHAGIIQ